MQPVFGALPELHLMRHDDEELPVRRDEIGLGFEAPGLCGDCRMEVGARAERLALPAGKGCGACGRRAGAEIA